MIVSYMKTASLLAAATVIALVTAGRAEAALINLGPGSFTPAASVITFSEPGRNLGDTDPVYTVGSNTIAFGEHFAGQTVSSLVGVNTLTGSPTGPLTLIQNGNTFIAGDVSNPTAPILSGSPLFNGPISFSFSIPVAAVGLSGGFFDAIGGTTIEAFDAAGVSLGTITNSTIGIEFYGLFDSSGSNISGVSFYITGSEPAGFAIDNVTFGDASVVTGVPEPASMALLGAGLAGLGLLRRRKAA